MLLGMRNGCLREAFDVMLASIVHGLLTVTELNVSTGPNASESDESGE